MSIIKKIKELEKEIRLSNDFEYKQDCQEKIDYLIEELEIENEIALHE